METIIKALILIALIWNLIVFFMMGIDKRRSKKGKWRISERTLLLCSLAFGALGGVLGMRVFHHKTLHKRFRYGLPVMLIAQLALITYLTFKF